MARFLGIDWDHDSLYLIAGVTGRRSARVEHALIWEEPHTLDLAAAEDAGRRLRDRLKEAKLAPGPVFACIGRERIVVKELRVPAVDARQEPALVQFQATKELTEPANRVVIDYTIARAAGAERVALVAVLRKQWLQALQALCKGAGLTLDGVTPRSYGIARCLRQSAAAALAAPAPAAGATVAVLTLGKRAAEFTIVRDGEIRLARPLAVNDNLLEDVRRNLALYANQTQFVAGRDAVQALYFAGDNQHAALQERLREALAIPVHALDPFAEEERVEVAGDRGGFAGLVGVSRLWAEQHLPIDFVHPKEPRPERTNKLRTGILVGALAAVLLLGAFVVAQAEVGKREGEVQAARQRLQDMDKQLERMKPDQQRLATLVQWDAGALPWVDEIYEVTKAFPQEEGFRVTQLSVAPLSANAARQHGPSMVLHIKGAVPPKLTPLVYDLVDRLNHRPYFQVKDPPQIKPGAKGNNKEAPAEFEISVNVTKDPAAAVGGLPPATPETPSAATAVGKN